MAKNLESWRLFWMLALTVSTAICLGLPFADFHTWRGTEFIILHAVLCALPFFLVAFTASSLATLWRSRRTRWLLSNRRYFGLAFAKRSWRCLRRGRRVEVLASGYCMHSCSPQTPLFVVYGSKPGGGTALSALSGSAGG
jgi:hypothetical protein